MTYENIVEGRFLSRPNRFTALAQLNGQTETVHVKNTGRCRELLIPGARILLQHHPDAQTRGRKTCYSLTAVYKGDRLVNIDSQAPNEEAARWLREGGLEAGTGIRPEAVRREAVFGHSRFDLAFTAGGRPAFMEVKGVTLERDGVALFPDAPTGRGVKHLEELAAAARQGYLAFLLFVIQMKGVRRFCPNAETDPAFAGALAEAAGRGVRILAYDCLVRENGFVLDQPVPAEVAPGREMCYNAAIFKERTPQECEE